MNRSARTHALPIPLLALALVAVHAPVGRGQSPPPAAAPGASPAPAAAAAGIEPAVDTSPPVAGGAARSPVRRPPARPGPATAPGSRVLDRVDLDPTQITGNRELPRVLYIVPWRRSDLGDLGGKPVNSLLDEVLAPIDRDVFRRETRYYETLQAAPPAGGGQGGGSAAADTAVPAPAPDDGVRGASQPPGPGGN